MSNVSLRTLQTEQYAIQSFPFSKVSKGATEKEPSISQTGHAAADVLTAPREAAVLKLQCEETEGVRKWYSRKQVPFYPQHFSLIQLGLLWMMSLNPHACPISTQRKSHIHTFWVILTPHSAALCFQPLAAHYIGFSGTCILESQWLSLTPHNITSSTLGS